MTRVAMLLSNAFRPDPRVLKEAQSLTQAGFEVTIICWDRLAELPAQETLSSGVIIERVQSIRSSYGIGARQLLVIPRFWHAALRILDRVKPSLVHCHDFDTLPAGLFWAKNHNIPIIYDAHEYYADLVKPRLSGLVGRMIYNVILITEKFCSRLANAVITVDDTLADTYARVNHRVQVLGHYPQVNMASQANPVFTRPGLTLIYGGRISTDRGALVYVDLVRYLREAGIPAELVLVGTFTPDNEEEKVRTRAKGLEKYIDYLGWVPYEKMQSVFCSVDIGLSLLLPEPRYVAALPVKLFEYMACGLPVIASNFPSITSIVEKSNCGIVADPLAEPAEIAQKIVQWWQEPSIPRSMGENGRQAILSTYNWERQVGKLSNLYDELINRRGV